MLFLLFTEPFPWIESEHYDWLNAEFRVESSLFRIGLVWSSAKFCLDRRGIQTIVKCSDTLSPSERNPVKNLESLIKRITDMCFTSYRPVIKIHVQRRIRQKKSSETLSQDSYHRQCSEMLLVSFTASYFRLFFFCFFSLFLDYLFRFRFKLVPLLACFPLFR